MLGRLGSLALLLLGCEARPPLAAVQPVHASPEGVVLRLEGTVESIELQNINKAKDHYTYNVSLLVAHDGLAASPFERNHEPGTLRVRTHKLYWGRLDETERQALAPGGPESTLSPQNWEGYAVGSAVALDVVVLSPGLALPR